MNDAPFRVPLVLPPERHFIPLLQAGYPRRDINVVGDEKGLPRAEFQDETLMPAPVVVVGEDSFDYAPAFDLIAAGALFKSAAEDLVTLGGVPALCGR
jgi:hypothetical protein